MSVETHILSDGIAHIELFDRVDSTNSSDVEAAVRKAVDDGHAALLIDMMDLAYISSAGLRVVLMAAQLMSKKNGRLALFGLNDNVRQVFEVSGFLKMLQVFATKDQATSYLLLSD